MQQHCIYKVLQQNEGEWGENVQAGMSFGSFEQPLGIVPTQCAIVHSDNARPKSVQKRFINLPFPRKHFSRPKLSGPVPSKPHDQMKNPFDMLLSILKLSFWPPRGEIHDPNFFHMRDHGGRANLTLFVYTCEDVSEVFYKFRLSLIVISLWNSTWGIPWISHYDGSRKASLFFFRRMV